MSKGLCISVYSTNILDIKETFFSVIADGQLLEADDNVEYTLDDIDARLDILMASLDNMWHGDRDSDPTIQQSILWD